MTVTDQSFAQRIAARYLQGGAAYFIGAQMALLKSGEEQIPESPLKAAVNNINLFQRILTENTILNVNIRFNFLQSLLAKTVREIGEATSRSISMLEKRTERILTTPSIPSATTAAIPATAASSVRSDTIQLTHLNTQTQTQTQIETLERLTRIQTRTHTQSPRTATVRSHKETTQKTTELVPQWLRTLQRLAETQTIQTKIISTLLQNNTETVSESITRIARDIAPGLVLNAPKNRPETQKEQTVISRTSRETPLNQREIPRSGAEIRHNESVNTLTHTQSQVHTQTQVPQTTTDLQLKESNRVFNTHTHSQSQTLTQVPRFQTDLRHRTSERVLNKLSHTQSQSQITSFQTALRNNESTRSVREQKHTHSYTHSQTHSREQTEALRYLTQSILRRDTVNSHDENTRTVNSHRHTHSQVSRAIMNRPYSATTPALRATPPQEGNYSRTQAPFPSLEGYRPQTGGWSRATANNDATALAHYHTAILRKENTRDIHTNSLLYTHSHSKSQAQAQDLRFRTVTVPESRRETVSEPARASIIHRKSNLSQARQEPQAPPRQLERDIEFIKKTVSHAPEITRTHTANVAVNVPGAQTDKMATASGINTQDINVQAIADKVYGALERRLRSEQMRRGLF